MDLGAAPGRANAADKSLNLSMSALAGAPASTTSPPCAGTTSMVLGHRVPAPSTIGAFLRGFS